MDNAEELQNGKKAIIPRGLILEANDYQTQGDGTGKNKAPQSPKNPNDSPGQSREHEQHLPIANVVRIMRKGLPGHAKVADESKEMMQECVSEFISFITSEANDKCQREHRKTVTAEDLIGAMARLGFDHYVEPLLMYLQKYRENEMFPMTTRFNLPTHGPNTSPGYDFVPTAAGFMSPTSNGLPPFSGFTSPTSNGLPPFAGPNMVHPQYAMFGYAGNGVYYNDGSGPISGTGNMEQDSSAATIHGRIYPTSALANMGTQCAGDGSSSSESPPAKEALYDPYGQFK